MLVHKIGRPSLFLLYMTTSLLLSWGFYLTVEKPFMMISRKVGSGTRVLVEV
jgi:peptidoglycan/LPS O-acetylase OafA/YrhL